jgi:MFS family permease
MTTVATTDRTRWDVVMLAFGCGVVGMFQTAKMSVALPQVQADVGLSLVGASWSLTAVSLCGAVFGIQAGRFSSEFGLSRTLSFALLLSGLAAFATALVTDPAAFLAARVVEGIGYLLVCAAAPAMMSAFAAPRDRGLALSIWGAFVPVSVALMSLVGPGILVAYGWRTLFLVSAALALAAAALVVATVPPLRGGAPGRISEVLRSAPADLGVLYTSLPSLGVGVAFMAFAALQVGFIALEPSFLVEARGIGLDVVGVILAVTTPFAILGTVLAGVLVRAGAPDAPMAAAGFAGMALAGSAVFLVPPGPLLLSVVGAAFFTAGGVVSSVIFAGLPKRALAVATVPLLSGLLVQFGNLGVLVGAPLLAAVAQTFTWEAVPLAVVAMAAVGAAGVVVGRP